MPVEAEEENSSSVTAAAEQPDSAAAAEPHPEFRQAAESVHGPAAEATADAAEEADGPAAEETEETIEELEASLELPDGDEEKVRSAPKVEPAVEKAPREITVDWSAKNVSRYGSPVDHYPHTKLRYVLYPTCRSQIGNITLFVLTCILTVAASKYVPKSVIHGKLFTIGSASFELYLPLLIFLPAILLGKILIRMYDSEYIIDGRGVEAKIGVLSMLLRQPRLRYEDIRGVEPMQTLWDRALRIGALELGSSVRDDIEIIMEGISEPREVQLFISGEIEKSLRRITQPVGVNGAAIGSAVLRTD